MLNEALKSAKCDGHLYHTLQEGAEKANDEDKQEEKNTFKNSTSCSTGENALQQILHVQQIKCNFTMRGRTPTEYQLQPITSYTNISEQPVRPPVFTPLFFFAL